MVTRQLRLNTTDQIRQKLQKLSGKKINIVMRDRTVFLGELQNITDTQLTFTNMRKDRKTILLDNISEVYLDSTE